MKKKWFVITGVLAVIVALGIGLYQSGASQADSALNHEEVKSLILSQYPGEITELELDKEQSRAVYEIEIENDGMEYELKVDANSGEILKLKEKRIASKESEKETVQEGPTEKITLENEQNNKQAQQAQKSNDKTKIESNEAKKETNEPKETKKSKNAVIDQKRAIEIALAEFPGKVEDVELDEDDGRLIYEIEIESGDLEAEFEIDAITGEIIVIEIDD